MNITANYIRKKYSTSTEQIDREVNKILLTIESSIIEAGKNGYSNIIASIPTNFNMINISNKISKTIIYNKLIEEIENNGFDILICMDDNMVTFCISWGIQKNQNELTTMREFIAKHIMINTEKKKDKCTN